MTVVATRWATVRILAVLALLLLGRGDGKATTTAGVYVGGIAGTDALIALVADDETAIGYTCGGSKTWKTHTGWFSTKNQAGKLRPARDAAGLALEGSFDGKKAQGKLTLADGTVLGWSAEGARPGTGAGLQARSEGGALTGLIVTNDGRKAGTTRLTGLGLTTTSAPVTVTGPPTGTTPTTTVGVTFPGRPVRTVTLTPVLDPRRLVITRPSPVIIVLLHGATLDIPRPDAAAIAADGVPGTRKHARRYWTYPFVAALLGADPTRNAPLTTLNGNDVTGNAFLNDRLLTNPSDGVDDIPGSSDCNFDDLITAERFPVPQTLPRPPGTPETPPHLSLLLAHRDGKKGLIEQSMDATNQIFACVTRFEDRFQQKPALVFVAHSYGGLVTRFIFSAPARAALAAVTNPDSGERLRFPDIADENASYDTGDDSVRVKMSTLRDQAVYAVTISTPHEGTRLMDRAAGVRTLVQHLRDGGASLTQAEQDLRDKLRSSLSLLLDIPEGQVLSAAPVVAALDSLDQQFSANRVMTEARPGMWRALNASALAPMNARRTGTSPIAGAAGRLIPIYTTGGRNPGGQVLDTLDLNNIRADWTKTNQLQQAARVQSQLLATIGGDYAYGFFDAVSGGPRRPADGFAPKLDRIERTDWVAFTTVLADSVLPNLNLFFRAEVGGDSSSVLRFVERGFGVSGNPNLPVYLNQTFAIDLSGTARVPVPTLSCGGTNITVDYGPLIRALGSTFGSLTKASASLQALNLAQFLNALRTFGGDLPTLVGGTTLWFGNTLKSVAGLSDACKDVTHLDRWRLTWLMTDVPAPRVLATGNSVSDDVIDDDGLVEYDSAMGFRLGTTTNEFFDHTRNDFIAGTSPAPGSWYRFYRSDVEQFSHEVMRFESGRWIWNTIVSRNAGPLPSSTGDLSVFP